MNNEMDVIDEINLRLDMCESFGVEDGEEAAFMKRILAHIALLDRRIECLVQDLATNTTGVQAIARERRRQVAVEGWTPPHDDHHHTQGQLSIAAGTYAMHAGLTIQGYPPAARFGAGGEVPLPWPWAKQWWKPTTPRRDLEKAGALIAAEIDRLIRSTT
jgi:hypothetical protein